MLNYVWKKDTILMIKSRLIVLEVLADIIEDRYLGLLVSVKPDCLLVGGVPSCATTSVADDCIDIT